MRGLGAAFYTEVVKARKSIIFLITIIAFSFMALMLGLLVFVAKHPELFRDAGIMSAKAAIVGNADWPSFLGMLVQTGAMIGSIGCGFVASWVFGREYADRTVKDLLALPVSRSTIVTAKFLVTAIWCALLALVLLTAGFIAGTVVGLETWSIDFVFRAVVMFSLTWLLNIILCAPLAFFACVSRGFLLPLGVLIFTMIMSQTLGVGMPAVAGYFPWAVPALYGVAALAGKAIGIISFLTVIISGIVGIIATLGWWRYADQV